MKRIVLLAIAVVGVAVLFLSCGSDSTHSVSPITPTTTSFAFLQQKPNSYLFYPVLGTFTGNQFTTSMVKDPSTGNSVSADMGSIFLNARGDKAVLDLYGGTNNAQPSYQWDIYIGTIDGANLTQVTNDADQDEVPQFNPAGTKVVYSSIGTDTAGQWATVIRNVDGTSEQVLPQPFEAEATWHPSFSPDGTKIAVQAASDSATPPFDGIVLMNADGSNPVLLTNPYGPDCWCVFDQEPFFTSDGSHIVFSRYNLAPDAADIVDIYIMKTDGTAVTKLTDSTGINFDPMVVRDSSSNADRILFSSNRDNLSSGAAGFELYTMKTDGTGLTRLTNNTVYDGFHQQMFFQGDSSSVVRPHQLRHWPATPPPPEHRLSW